MKKLAMIGVVLALAMAFTFADTPVATSALPQAAQDFIADTFPGIGILSVEAGRNEFEVMLANGTEVDFDGKGNWETVKNATMVPASLLPWKAADYINSAYFGTNIIEIEKNPGSYVVKLANHWDLLFNSDGNFLSDILDVEN